MNSTPPTERLEKRLARVAREQGIDQERLRRWISFLALCGVLERAIHGVLGDYCLKGGAAMELRFAQRARATKDLDLGIEGSRTIRTIRVEVAVQYRTRAWQTIEVDLGPAKAGPVDLVDPYVQGLTELGIPVTSPVRCLRLADQVAQKNFTPALDRRPRAGRGTYSTSF